MVNSFATFWSSYSSDSTFTKQFAAEKQKSLEHKLLPSGNPALSLESNISTDEFDDTLSNSRGKTPGVDRITNHAC